MQWPTFSDIVSLHRKLGVEILFGVAIFLYFSKMCFAIFYQEYDSVYIIPHFIMKHDETWLLFLMTCV